MQASGIDQLLHFISIPESNGNPDAYWGKIRTEHKPPKRLTEMSVQEVLAWQDSIDPLYMSEASGEYQFMEDTLRGLWREAGVQLDDLFDERTQRALALALLKRRGLEDYLAGQLSAEQFAQNLSKEWASLPAITRDRAGRPAQGQSYYAGDGLNKAHVTIAATMEAVNAVRATTPIVTMPAPAVPELPRELVDLMEECEGQGSKTDLFNRAIQYLSTGGAFTLMSQLNQLDWRIVVAGIAAASLVFAVAVYTRRSRGRKAEKAAAARYRLEALGQA
ncbi:MAG: hypothetical protein AAFR53_11945 [Pseudomonadota bacterium]